MIEGINMHLSDAILPIQVSISWGHPECPICRRRKMGGTTTIITCPRCSSRYRVYDICYPSPPPKPSVIYKSYLIFKGERADLLSELPEVMT